MKFTTILAAAALTCAAGLSARAFDSLDGLMTDMAAKQAIELKQYIKDHPKAGDLDQAQQMLIMSLMYGTNKSEAVGLLEKRYEKISTDTKNADLQEAIGGCVIPLLQCYIDGGQKDKARAFAARVKKDFASNEQAEQIGQAIDQATSDLDIPGVGDTLDVKFTAVDGKTEVNLGSMTGKVVLVDFWATWCGPCVQELPNVKAVYDKFHAKGFDVVGISLDEKKDKLTDFIASKNIPWPQYFDGKGWENKYAVKYSIHSIPATFLVGKDGKIVAVGLRGPALEKKVAELLK